MNARLLGTVVLVFGLTACGSGRASRVDDHELVETKARGVLKGRPTIAMPIPLPGQNTHLIPFSMEERKGLFDDDDAYDRAWSRAPRSSPWHQGSTWQQSVRWHNAILQDKATGEEWLVLNHRGVISEWFSFGRPPEPEAPARCERNIFIATVEDTNGDGVLNNLDATVAIVAEGDGRRPRIVSPKGAQIWNVTYDFETRLVYFYVVPDTNNDGLYSSLDVSRPYVFDAKSEGPARPILSETIMARAEALLK